MGGQMNRGLTTSRVWSMLIESGPMTSPEIYEEYNKHYSKNGINSPSAFTQILRRTGLFVIVGEKKIVTEYLTKTKATRMVSVWDAKPLSEIIKPYIGGSHPLRKLSRMPKFVRDAVKEWEATQ